MGYPGSVHDARVFRTSPLFQNLENKCNNYHLLGDSAYPCLKNLLTPFKDRGQLTRRQQNYNTLLSSNRYVVEHCFGLIKQRFRQLYHIKLRSIEEIVHFIRACIVLHNLCIDDDLDNENPPVNIREVQVDQNLGENDDLEDDRDGITKRNNIMALLPLL